MLDNFGFTIQNAVDISKRIINRISKKHLNSYLNISAPFTQESYYNPKYILTVNSVLVKPMSKEYSNEHGYLIAVSNHL